VFNGTFRHLGRTRQIIQVLIKYGFEDVVTNTPLQNVIPKRLLINWMREDRNVYQSTRWERIRMACEELGPTFIKLAQILSNRPDLLPEGLINELKKLQSQVAPFPFKQVLEILEEDLPRSHKLIFDYIDEKPVGSASIGQVHRARLATGEDVVIKVRRPGVSKIMHQDLEIIKDIVVRAEGFLLENGVINAMDAVEAFEKSMYKELDYKHEARNIESFRNFYKKRKDFYVPRAYREYSTDRILIIEYAAGCKITDVKQLKAWGLDPKNIAERGMDIYLTQIFEFGYFHADPHPGNILIQQDGRICLIDFGMVGKLMKRDKLAFANVFVSMARLDAKTMALNMKKLSIDDNIDDIRMLEYDLNEIIEDYASLDISESSIEDLVDQLQRVMFNYKMRVPGGVFLIFRAMAVLEGIGKQIHPHFNVSEFVRPYGFRLLKEQYSPETLAEEAMFRLTQIGSFLNSIPVELRTILKKTRQGKLNFEITHKGYDPLLRKMDRVVNRFILTFVIFTLTTSSSILALVPMHPRHIFDPLGIPYLSLVGFLFSMFLGTVLLFAVLRTRNL
jgi:ubiquinone biosynthesis protein